jgi:hypothetical protein
MLIILTEESEVLVNKGKLSSGGSNWISSFEVQECPYKIERICGLILLGEESNQRTLLTKVGCYDIGNRILRWSW